MNKEETFKDYKEKQKYYRNKTKEVKVLHISNEIIKGQHWKDENIVGRGITYIKPKGESK